MGSEMCIRDRRSRAGFAREPTRRRVRRLSPVPRCGERATIPPRQARPHRGRHQRGTGSERARGCPWVTPLRLSWSSWWLKWSMSSWWSQSLRWSQRPSERSHQEHPSPNPRYSRAPGNSTRGTQHARRSATSRSPYATRRSRTFGVVAHPPRVTPPLARSNHVEVHGVRRAFMQAMGLVNDHVPGCDCREACEAERAALVRPTHRS